MKKIGYLGAGVWGYSLACLLASKGYHVTSWSMDEEAVAYMQERREHHQLKGISAPHSLSFTTDIEKTLIGKDLIVEVVTSAGIRQIFQTVNDIGVPDCPIVLTSKGIEQNTGLLLSDVVLTVLSNEHKKQIGCLSGPSIAQEVLK